MSAIVPDIPLKRAAILTVGVVRLHTEKATTCARHSLFYWVVVPHC